MPAAAVIPVVLGVTGASAAIGATVATAIGLGTVSAVAATAIGSGIVAGVMTAAQGGDAGDVLKSAVLGGVTSYVGGTIAGSLGDANFVAADATQLAAQGLSEAAIVQNLVGAGVNEAAAAAAAAQAVLGASSFAIQQAVLGASGGGTDIFAQPQAYTGLSYIEPDDITALMQEGYSASNLSELALDGVNTEDLYSLREAGYNPTELVDLVDNGISVENLKTFDPSVSSSLAEGGLGELDFDQLRLQYSNAVSPDMSIDDIKTLLDQGYTAEDIRQFGMTTYSAEDIAALRDLGISNADITAMADQYVNEQTVLRYADQGYDANTMVDQLARGDQQAFTNYVSQPPPNFVNTNLGTTQEILDVINTRPDLLEQGYYTIDGKTVSGIGYGQNSVEMRMSDGTFRKFAYDGTSSLERASIGEPYQSWTPDIPPAPVAPPPTDITITPNLPAVEAPVPTPSTQIPYWMPEGSTAVSLADGTQAFQTPDGVMYDIMGNTVTNPIPDILPTPITPPVETLPEFGQTPAWLPEGSQPVSFPDGTPGFQTPGSNLIYDASGNIIGDASQLTGGIQAGIPSQIPAGPADLVSTGVSDSAPGTILMGPQGPEVVLDNGKTVLIDDYVRALDSGQTLTVDGTALTPATADAGTTLQTGATTPGQINITGAPLQAGAELPAGTQLPPGTRLATSAEIDAGLAGDSAVDLGDGTFAWVTQTAPTAPAVPGMDIDVTDLIPGPAPTPQPPPVDTAPVIPPPVMETPPPVMETPPPVMETTPVDTAPVIPPPVMETPPPVMETTPVDTAPVIPPPVMETPPPVMETTPPVMETTPPVLETTGPTTIQPIVPGETQPSGPITTIPTEPVIPVDVTAPPVDQTPVLVPPVDQTAGITPPTGPVPTGPSQTYPAAETIPTVDVTGGTEVVNGQAPIDTATNVVPGTNTNSGITPAQNLAGAIGERLAGLSMAEIAALAAAGLLTASELAKYNQMRPSGYNYTFTPVGPNEIFSRGLVNPGVNPGEVLGAIRPAYQTTQPYQQQYYWGQQPYFAQRSDLVNYNQIPGGLPPPDYQPTPWFAQPAAYELPVYGPGMNIVGGTR